MAWGGQSVVRTCRSRSASPQPSSARPHRAVASKLENLRPASRSASPRPGGSHVRTATPEPVRSARLAGKPGNLRIAPKPGNYFQTVKPEPPLSWRQQPLRPVPGLGSQLRSATSVAQPSLQRGLSEEPAFSRPASPLVSRRGASPRPLLAQRAPAARSEARVASTSPCPSQGSRGARGASVGLGERRGLHTIPQRRQSSPWDAQIRNEIRDLRGAESRLHWEMRKKTKQDTVTEENVSVTDMMKYRWRLQDEMKTHLTEKARAEIRKALEESRLRLDHKREKKRMEKDIDCNYESDALSHAKAHSIAQAELVRIAEFRDKERAAQRRDSKLHLTQARLNQRLQDKLTDDSERAHELRIEQARQVQELSKERDELLHRVELARAAHGGAPKPILMAPRPASRSASPMSKRSTQRSPASPQRASLKQ